MTVDEMIIDAIQESCFKLEYKKQMLSRIEDLLISETECEKVTNELDQINAEKAELIKNH